MFAFKFTEVIFKVFSSIFLFVETYIYLAFFENAKRCYNAFVWEGGSRDIMLKVEKSIIDFRSMKVEGTFPLALWRPLISVFYF